MKRHKTVVVVLLATLIAASAAAAGSMIGKLYVKQSEVLLTERSGQPCLNEVENYCERSYMCPEGKAAHALVYNIKEDRGEKILSGLSLVCADPNAFQQPETVGASGETFSGDVVTDYCPVGYLLAGSEFFTNEKRLHLTGVRRVCRRYEPYDELRSQDVFGNGVDSMANVCPEKHWVSGLKMSYRREVIDGRVDTQLINVRYYCSEVRHWLVEPDPEEVPGR
ncbi:MAG TPA: hypothetical protein PK961_13965 [bacterium]|nr:hypothetical protein [bacterium]